MNKTDGTNYFMSCYHGGNNYHADCFKQFILDLDLVFVPASPFLVSRGHKLATRYSELDGEHREKTLASVSGLFAS
jgi:hypothetical protein